MLSVSKGLSWGKKWISEIYNGFLSENQSESDEFEGLNPYIEENKSKHRNDIYTKALRKALSDPKIKNIAVTGGFGAGKSSFLRSFEHHNEDWKYLFISLATFKDKKGEENNQLIERSILQQLFYKVRKRKIPASRYDRLQNLYFWRDSKQFITLFIWLVSALLIFKPDILSNLLVIKNLNLLELCNSHQLLCAIPLRGFFLVTSLIVTWWVYKYLSNFRVTDLNLKGGMSVSEKSKDSLLNEKIDEILYFFEATDFNVIVIEDLDRSNNQEIFVKLREINELINQSDQVKKDVNFIYAIKDEMFEEEDTRTKFFDFMIPIIPYIHHSNSYSKLKDKFPEYNMDIEFQKLLRKVSEYIYDMRLLINIVNEFKVYSEKVEFIDSSKLLAMIVYKNVYPKDFSELHKNKGVLTSIFNSETAFRQKAQIDINTQISSINSEIIHFKKYSI